MDNRSQNELMVTAEQAVALCDRNFGIGGDGVRPRAGTQPSRQGCSHKCDNDDQGHAAAFVVYGTCAAGRRLAAWSANMQGAGKLRGRGGPRVLCM